MVPVVAGERDCPIVDVLAVDNYKVDVVKFEYPFFYLAYDFPHSPQSEEGIRRYDNDDIRIVARQLILLVSHFPLEPDSIVAPDRRPQKAARQAPFLRPWVKQTRLLVPVAQRHF